MEKLLKFLVYPILSLPILSGFGLAQAGDPSGRWTATPQRGDRTGVAVINLKVEGNRVTGTLSDPSGHTMEKENGVIEGGQLSFDCPAREHGDTERIDFAGQVTNDTITLHNESHGKQGRTMTFHRANDFSAFTLSLPIRRASVLRAQSFVALVELVALRVLRAFLIHGLSRIVGVTFPMTQTLRYAALLICPAVVFHGWSLLVSQLTGNESTSLTIAFTSIGAFFILVKRIHALDSLEIFDNMSGADLLDRNTFLLHGPLPWVTFLTASALLLGMVWLSILLIERHDF